MSDTAPEHDDGFHLARWQRGNVLTIGESAIGDSAIGSSSAGTARLGEDGDGDLVEVTLRSTAAPSYDDIAENALVLVVYVAGEWALLGLIVPVDDIES